MNLRNRQSPAGRVCHPLIRHRCTGSRSECKAALEKLNYLEESILSLGDNLYAGAVPRYTVLKRQGYLVLILEKDLVFYKVDDDKKLVTVYAVVDQRQDYLSIIRGL